MCSYLFYVTFQKGTKSEVNRKKLKVKGEKFKATVACQRLEVEGIGGWWGKMRVLV
jgi:hypothetical protein